MLFWLADSNDNRRCIIGAVAVAVAVVSGVPRARTIVVSTATANPLFAH
jgi:hypothetical protein